MAATVPGFTLPLLVRQEGSMNTSSARSTVMAMGAGLLVAGLVLLGPARTSGPPFTTVHAGRSPLADHLVVNEVQYDPPQIDSLFQ
jgi:hypothetical protein